MLTHRTVQGHTQGHTHHSQFDSKAHSSCIILRLDTAIHNLPLLIFHCLSLYSLFTHISLMSQTYLVLCHMHSFIQGIPEFGDPLHFFKSIMPPVLLSALSPLNSYCLSVLPTSHFYCCLTLVTFSAFLYLISPPHH